MRFHYGDDALFICGYEAGCLGFTLYHQLTDHNMKCVILAPITMLQQKGKKKVKTDKRDAALIARCLAHHPRYPWLFLAKYLLFHDMPFRPDSFQFKHDQSPSWEELLAKVSSPDHHLTICNSLIYGALHAL